eukprot:g67260.t1
MEAKGRETVTVAKAELEELQAKVALLEQKLRDVSGQRELLSAVLQITCKDCTIKQEQFQSLFTNLHANPVWQQAMRPSSPALPAVSSSASSLSHLPAQPPSPASSASDISQMAVATDVALPTAKQSQGRSATPRRARASTRKQSWAKLPSDLVQIMLGALGYNDYAACALVCRQWSKVLRSEAVWRQLFVLHWHADFKYPTQDVWRLPPSHAAPFPPKTPSRTVHLPSPASPSSDTLTTAAKVVWRSRFHARLKVERSWSPLYTPCVSSLAGHNGTVTCLKFKGNQLVSGSDDGSLHLWRLKAVTDTDAPLFQQHHNNTKVTYKISSFMGHGGPVWCLDTYKDLLVSGSYDQTIKVWSLRAGTAEATLRGHTSWVSCVSVHDAIIVSGSWDATLKLWRLSSPSALPALERKKAQTDNEQPRIAGSCVATMEGHAGNVIYCLQWNRTNNTVVTGTRRQAVEQWDLYTGQRQLTYMGHTKQVYCLQSDSEKVVSGSGDHSIKVWDPRSARCEMTLNAHSNPVLTLQYKDHKMISGGYDKAVTVWDMRVGAAVKSLEGHSAAVFACQFDGDKIVSGAADKLIKVWNFSKQGVAVSKRVVSRGGNLKALFKEGAPRRKDVRDLLDRM